MIFIIERSWIPDLHRCFLKNPNPHSSMFLKEIQMKCENREKCSSNSRHMVTLAIAMNKWGCCCFRSGHNKQKFGVQESISYCVPDHPGIALF